MTHDEALRIGRKAVEDARKRVGDKQESLIEEIEKICTGAALVTEAFAITGHLILESIQETKH
jgi:hypothetical protein